MELFNIGDIVTFSYMFKDYTGRIVATYIYNPILYKILYITENKVNEAFRESMNLTLASLTEQLFLDWLEYGLL